MFTIVPSDEGGKESDEVGQTSKILPCLNQKGFPKSHLTELRYKILENLTVIKAIKSMRSKKCCIKCTTSEY